MKFKPLSSILKKNTEAFDIFSGAYELELTDDVIADLLTLDGWNDWTEEKLKDYRNKGYKYNTKRNSLMQTEWI